jgi:RNA-binding motif X-linked protein 2
MNGIRKINDINQKELAQNVSEKASWHYDYRDTSYIFIGNLPLLLVEHDIITIFSQWGVPTHIHLVKDRETRKSRGFCYLKYVNFKSCILAIDNFNGIKVLDRTIKVDHVYFKIQADMTEDDFLIEYPDVQQDSIEIESKPVKLLPYKSDEKSCQVDNDRQQSEDGEESKNANSMNDNVDDVDDEFKDPMEAFLLVRDSSSSSHKSHRSHRSHRSHKSSSQHHHRSHRHKHDDSSRHLERRSRTNLVIRSETSRQETKVLKIEATFRFSFGVLHRTRMWCILWCTINQL